jgi:hypothetical protein
MRRILFGMLTACVVAAFITACGSSPATPTPNPGGGGDPGAGGPPPIVNTPPQIKSIAASDARAEVGTPITLTAAVEDQDTPVANLTYAWTAATGTFTGTGAVVTWVAGQDAKTPADVILTLTVTERYTSGSITVENKASSTTSVHLNNSPKELAELSLRFLGDFATSSVSPEKCVSEFSDSCGGKKEELGDITDNRHDFLILASELRTTGVDIAGSKTTATVHTFCSFTSRVITRDPWSEGCRNEPGSCPFNGVGTAKGDCWTTNVYEKGRWWLCTSRYTPAPGMLTSFARAFFGIRGPEIP